MVVKVRVGDCVGGGVGAAVSIGVRMGVGVGLGVSAGMTEGVGVASDWQAASRNPPNARKRAKYRTVRMRRSINRYWHKATIFGKRRLSSSLICLWSS